MTETHIAATPVPAGIATPTRLRRVTNAVLQWNEVLLDAALVDSQRPPSARDQNGPTRASRAAAIVQAAVFNAVVGIRGRYRPYRITLPPVPANAVPREAVAGAAFGALVRLYPSQRASLQATASHYFDPAAPSPSAAYGLEVGRLQVLERARDGSAGMGVYSEPLADGIWRPDPLDPTQRALDPHWGRVRPFALTPAELRDAVDALPAPPGYRADGTYNLRNAAYRRALEEVRRIGSVEASPPEADSTLNAVFWSYDEGRGTPIRLYNQAVRAVGLRAGTRGNLPWARLFFLANLAMADAGIAAWAVKYRYDLWRPIHGVRLDPIAPDRGWTPLGKQLPFAPVEHCSPPFPAYVSGHAAFGEAMFHTLALFYGTDWIPFELASDEHPREARNYRSLDAASRDNARSRVQLGVHFSFDGTRGRTLGRQVSDRAFSRLSEGALLSVPGLEIVGAEADDE
ncbi:MAG TPA: hypothetical protein VHG91_21375 [Longimicrobium sp.]|nr:hypothetical protein [Longimicrobium sp.]